MVVGPLAGYQPCPKSQQEDPTRASLAQCQLCFFSSVTSILQHFALVLLGPDPCSANNCRCEEQRTPAVCMCVCMWCGRCEGACVCCVLDGSLHGEKGRGRRRVLWLALSYITGHHLYAAGWLEGRSTP